jgi:rhamnosyltransferase
MNDTCFGPLCDLGAIYADYERRPVDFWAITGAAYSEAGMPGAPEKPVPAHLQSYFICFSQKVIRSAAWANFWQNVADETEVEKVIQKYETQLTGVLMGAGLVGAAKLKVDHGRANFIIGADQIINDGAPFVKARAFPAFGYPAYLAQLVGEKPLIRLP